MCTRGFVWQGADPHSLPFRFSIPPPTAIPTHPHTHMHTHRPARMPRRGAPTWSTELIGMRVAPLPVWMGAPDTAAATPLPTSTGMPSEISTAQRGEGGWRGAGMRGGLDVRARSRQSRL